MSHLSQKRQQLEHLYSTLPGYSTNLLTELKGNRLWITFNRAGRYNAFTTDMYINLTRAFHQANANSQVKYIIITGNGGNFSSGNDLQNFITSSQTNIPPKELARITSEIIFQLTEAIINSQKPIFAITEGKVIGFAFTQLLLYDRVFVVEGSQFNAPLVKLAQGPEMCSAFTFPKFFGQKAGEDLIVSGRKVDAAFLEKHRVATACKSRTEALQLLEQHLQELDTLDWTSYINTRRLFRDIDRDALHRVNRAEAENLCERWSSPDLVPFLMNYMSKMKTKAKPKL